MRALILSLAAFAPLAFPVSAHAFAPQPQQGDHSKKLERRAALIAEARTRGNSRVGDMLGKVPPAEHLHPRTSLALRAWLESGGAPNAVGIEVIVAAHQKAAPARTVEEGIALLEIVLALPAAGKDARARSAELATLQASDGAFPASRALEKRERADDAALTARALYALLDHESAALDAAVRRRTVEYLLRAQRADGGVGVTEANGAATAASAAVWLRCAAIEDDAALQERLARALDRAERWLRASDRFDQNPGARSDAFLWLHDHARAARLLLIPVDPEKSSSSDRDAFLAEYQLQDWGWNRSASMNDVMGSGGGISQKAGGSRGVATQVVFDFSDTAAAMLALCARVKRTERETELALRRRFLSRAAIPPSVCWDGLAEMLRPAPPPAIALLIEKLEDEESAIRRCADHLLQALTGEDFGFVPGRRRDDPRNAEAVKAWQAWLSKR